MSSRRRVVIGLGSNTADRHAMMHEAVAYLVGMLENVIVSEIYPTEPECEAKHPYLNAVVSGETDLGRDELSEAMKNYERRNGRTDEGKLRDIIPIDLDLVVYGEDVLRPDDFKREYFTTGYRQLIK